MQGRAGRGGKADRAASKANKWASQQASPNHQLLLFLMCQVHTSKQAIAQGKQIRQPSKKRSGPTSKPRQAISNPIMLFVCQAQTNAQAARKTYQAITQQNQMGQSASLAKPSATFFVSCVSGPKTCTGAQAVEERQCKQPTKQTNGLQAGKPRQAISYFVLSLAGRKCQSKRASGQGERQAHTPKQRRQTRKDQLTSRAC